MEISEELKTVIFFGSILAVGVIIGFFFLLAQVYKIRGMLEKWIKDNSTKEQKG